MAVQGTDTYEADNLLQRGFELKLVNPSHLGSSGSTMPRAGSKDIVIVSEADNAELGLI